MVRKTAKHVARNKKKYWRKISTKDIDDHLEDVRIEEMTGGRRSDQPDEVLYQIDNERPLGSTTEENETIVKKRPKLDLNHLNSYKILEPHSTVAPPGNESRQKKDPSSKSTKRLVESQILAEKRRVAKKKYQNALKQRLETLEKNALEKAEKLEFDDPQVSKSYDLWNKNDEKQRQIQSLVGPKFASYLNQIDQTFDWKVPKHILNKPSKLPSIEKPLPGTSYNPTFDDHQDLLLKAHRIEIEKERKQMKLEKNLPKSLTQSEAEPIKKLWIKEMSSGLFDENNENEENFQLDSVSVGKPVQIERKTVSQRNKEKLRKKKDALAKAAKQKRIENNKIFQLKSIRKEIQNEIDQQKKREEKRQIDFENREKFGTKKFGRHKFEEQDLDLNLSNELTGNLRTMKTEGNLLHDRFKSLQKRNIIETRVRAKKTKTKMKKYQKRSVREIGFDYRPK